MAGSSIWAPVGDKGPDGDPGPIGPPGLPGPTGGPGPDAATFLQYTQDMQNALDVTKGASLVGFRRVPLTVAINTVAKILSTRSYNIWEFAGTVVNKPTPSDPNTWDWTPAFVAADAAIAGSGPLPTGTNGMIEVGTGLFPVTTFTLSHQTSLAFCGGTLTPFNDVSRRCLVKAAGYNKIVNLSIDAKYAMNYECMVWCRGRYINVESPEIWTARCAYMFGDSNWEFDPPSGILGDSEIYINGGSTNWGITVAKYYGQNTIVNWTGGHRGYSYKWTLPEGDPRKVAWEALVEYGHINCGALVYIDSGLSGNFSALAPNFYSKLQPVSGDAAYQNSFGRFYMTGSHLETGFILQTAPVGAYPAQDSRTKLLTMINVNGFLSTTPGYVIDAGGDCMQGIEISSCGMYGATQNKIVYAVKAPTHVSPDSFTTNTVDFFQTLQVQKPRGYANFCPLIVSSSAQALTPTPSAIKMPVFIESDINDGFKTTWYSTSTGIFTSKVAMRNIEVSIVLSLTAGTPTDATDFILVVNGAQVDTASGIGPAPRAIMKISKLLEGDVVEIRVAQYQSRATNGSTANKVIITGAV